MNISKYLKKNHPVREWGESLVIAFILAMFIRTFIIQAFKIPTASMRMTLIEGDRILVNKLRYGPMVPILSRRLPGYGSVQRGDVIVFKYPEDLKKDYVKRLVGLPGEEIEIRSGDIYIDGNLVKDERIKNIQYYNRGDYARESQAIKVPEGYFFVLGDNSASSADSRYWGFVSEDYLVGKAEMIYWPLHRMRVIQ